MQLRRWSIFQVFGSALSDSSPGAASTKIAVKAVIKDIGGIERCVNPTGTRVFVDAAKMYVKALAIVRTTTFFIIGRREEGTRRLQDMVELLH